MLVWGGRGQAGTDRPPAHPLPPARPAIRQIAVLPYRTTGPVLDSAVEVMLVTSRETRRWVLPKGNRMKGLSAHAAAAQEAFEEAGIEGSVCPTLLGTYTYNKVMRSGSQIPVEVEVFPFAVTAELEQWPEQTQRNRRWFPLAEAIEAVDESDLKDLLRSFRASQFTAIPGSRPERVGPRSGRLGLRLFHGLRALLPRQEYFFTLFERHGQTLVAGSGALARLLQGGAGMGQFVVEIVEREEEADGITRETLQAVRSNFLPPFARGAITSLIAAMDDAIDEMRRTAGAINLYELAEFEQEMRDVAAIIVDSARLLSEALPLLRSIHTNASRLHELTGRIVRMEDHADEIHAAGLKKAFKTHGKGDTLGFIIAREIYSHLKKVVDRLEDVANEIDGLVIDHA